MTNIHACLVHEEPDCVVDLVANLRRFDPESLVLLYDGSADQRLLRSGALAEGDGVMVHPQPRPMTWGRLHGFAFDSLKYALQTVDFSSVTIVDSDQLMVRGGYAATLDKHLTALNAQQVGPRGEPLGTVGCLVSHDGGTQPRDTRSALAKMAWREFDLWRPFLRRFAHGERYWPTWTFWPGTTFTRDAAADLVELSSDPQLAALLHRTRLWATEELVLPTLVALRGHRVVPTPLCDDLVRFRVPWSAERVAAAAQQSDLFWVHPVPRRLDDPVRSWVRSSSTAQPAPGITASKPPVALTDARPLPRPLLEATRVLRAMDALAGSTSRAEADLLMGATLHVLTTPPPHVVVAVGGLSPRERHVLDAVARAVDPATRVASLDDGRQEGPDEVALALLGATADFANTATAYAALESRLRAGALVVFRGYSPAHPGPVRLLDHLVGAGAVEWVGWAGSLAVTRFLQPAGVVDLGAVLDEMDAVEGWLSRDEAAYLALLAADAVQVAPRAAVVEVGSYCGRGTVVLARVSSASGGTTGRRGRVHAVDTFDGVVGSAPDRLHHGEPTWKQFRDLVDRSGLRRRVVAHRGRSTDLSWTQPVSLLVVDGWHDYASVRADVDSFAPYVVVGGTVAFHDHADYAPGVARVLAELVGTGDWERSGEIGTLAAVRRTRISERTPRRPVVAAPRGPAPEPVVTPDVLVSCLMPTRDRPDLVRFALTMFARQDLAERELVVVDDGVEPVDELVAGHPRVVYIRASRQRSIGAKRNLAAEAARGSHLAHWDDDDWYAPHRLSSQLAALTRAGHSVVGAASLHYWEAAAGRAWRYDYPHADAGRWAHDATLLLEASAWRAHRYPDANHGLDQRWLTLLPPGNLLVDDTTTYVGLMHPRNTSRKNTDRACWTELPVSDVESLVGDAMLEWSAATGLVPAMPMAAARV